MKKELLKDVKMGLILASLIVPFPLLGIASAPLYAWGLFALWYVVVIYANTRPKKRKPKKEFHSFVIDRQLVDELNELEDVS